MTTPDKDHLRATAAQAARASFHHFLALATQPHESASVKITFFDGKQHLPHVWTDVLAISSATEFDVRPIPWTPSRNRRWTLSVQDIEDWQLRDCSGRLHGAFTEQIAQAGAWLLTQ